jgi:hypothetical protein
MTRVQFLAGAMRGFFCIFATVFRLALGLTQPPIQCVLEARSLGVKQSGHEAIPPVHQYIFMAWYFVNHRNNFTFCIFTLLYSDHEIQLLAFFIKHLWSKILHVEHVR